GLCMRARMRALGASRAPTTAKRDLLRRAVIATAISLSSSASTMVFMIPVPPHEQFRQPHKCSLTRQKFCDFRHASERLLYFSDERHGSALQFLARRAKNLTLMQRSHGP